ncbi:MAG: 16S rRNA processing protein RimM [Oscillospiraceae bacterium]|nr:16S rRNA processing protein RimM [Oscillospiraceae bacterium]
MRKQYLEIGKIVTVHGLGGIVKVQPWCDDAEFLCEFEVLYCGRQYVPMKIQRASVQKNMALVKFKGVDTVEQAQALRNSILYMDRNDVELEEGTYFIQDLIGLKVSDADTGADYGKIADVLQTGANDVYLLRDDSGKERLVPVIPDVVTEIEPEQGYVKIRPLKGLFDDAD